MILILRGHIRDSFENNKLYNFIKILYAIDNDLNIYIHTWSIKQNNLSWRHINFDSTPITEDYIKLYFKDLFNLIKHIIIEDDNKITLQGQLEGNVSISPMPIKGWKNYWYGQYQIINYIKENIIDSKINIINMRFDIFNVIHNALNEQELILFILKNKNIELSTNSFITDYNCNGIDNVFMGNISSQYKLIEKFYKELDNIIKSNPPLGNQERYVFIVNQQLC